MNGDKHISMPFGASLGEDGIWCQLLNRIDDRRTRPALFLDRDGVIVKEVHYLSRPDDVQLIDGAATVIIAANAKRIPVIIVTNQAGVGYGKFDWQDFIDVQEKILEELDRKNAFINAVFACPFHEKALPPYQQADHPCRKPNPGMLQYSERYFNIDKAASFIIGDRANDLLAGQRFGLGCGLHVQTGHGAETSEQSQAAALNCDDFRVLSIPSIDDCLPHLQWST